MATSLAPGQIIWAELRDPAGRNPKRRPVVVLSHRMVSADTVEVVGVAVTTQLPRPLPDEYVALPWQRNRRVRTRLGEPSAAVCSWNVRLTSEESQLSPEGFVDPRLLEQIVAKVNEHLRRQGTSETNQDSPK